MSEPATVADVLPQMAASRPEATAIYFPGKRRGADGLLEYTQISYRELDQRSDRIAAGLHAVGIKRGDRAVLMVKPSPDLFALTFAMFKAGVVPVMIDPGLGKAGLAQGISRARPSAFIGIPVAHLARKALGWGRETVTRTVSVGGWGLGDVSLAKVEALGAEALTRGSAREVTGSTSPDEVA
ncbi:MAG: AMP-binding protein, partial [Myxococcales bacterium]|nr:AMP-binding protein [Myxococcales bacterium]